MGIGGVGRCNAELKEISLHAWKAVSPSPTMSPSGILVPAHCMQNSLTRSHSPTCVDLTRSQSEWGTDLWELYGAK